MEQVENFEEHSSEVDYSYYPKDTDAYKMIVSEDGVPYDKAVSRILCKLH